MGFRISGMNYPAISRILFIGILQINGSRVMFLGLSAFYMIFTRILHQIEHRFVVSSKPIQGFHLERASTRVYGNKVRF